MPTLIPRLKSRDGSLSEDGHRSYTMEYLVESDTLNVSPALIDAAIGVAYYAPYPDDPPARLKRKRISQEGNELYFHRVVHEYDTRRTANDTGTTQPGEADSAPGDPGQNSGNTSPLDRPWVLKWGSVQTERVIEKDKDGKPILNSAMQPFDPAIAVQVANPTLTISAVRLTAQVEKILRFTNKVNRREFLGAAKWHARCTQYAISSVFELGAYYWQVDVTVEFKEGGWNPSKYLDAGTVEATFNEQGQVVGYRAIMDRLNSPVTSPVPLNGSGKKLENVNPLSPAAFSYLEFRLYDDEDFSQLI